MNQRLTLKDLNCPHCAGVIEEKTSHLKGVRNASFNMMTKVMDIELEGENDSLIEEVKNIVKETEPSVTVIPYENRKTDDDDDDDGITRLHVIRLVAGLALLFAAVIFSRRGIVSLPFYIAAYIVFGYDVIINAVRNILHGELFDENFLMSIATIGAFFIGEYPEAAAVMLFYQVGELFQDIAVGKASRSVKSLIEIMPENANLVNGNEVITIPAKDVEPGQILLIKPGEKVPLDGVVTEGSSYIDKKALTGESVPEYIKEGDSIPSGAINGNTPVKIKATKGFENSTAQKIVRLTEEAASKKSKAERFITGFAKVYTPTVVFLALAVAVLPTLYFGFDTFSDWLYRALIFLVASCPCALVVSIPLGFFAGNGKLSSKGILVKGSSYIQSLAEADTVAFDKTGTLTKGIFRIESVSPVGISAEELLDLCGCAETYSNHPIAAAICMSAKKDRDIAITDYEEISGMGVRAVCDGKAVLAGNSALMDKFGIKYNKLKYDSTTVYVAIDNRFAGTITVADTVKEDSKKTISSLKAKKIKTVMLTGDNGESAERLNSILMLDEVKSGLLPGDKLDCIEKLYENGSKTIVYLGDGINDAPVLKRVDVGTAMGGLGSDTAIEAADAVIMNDEPSKILTAIELSGKTMARIRQNTVFVIAVKIIVLIISALGFGNMWLAIFADIGTALIAILNSIR